MGEIERIRPVIPSSATLRPADRIQPNGDRRHQQHAREDALELTNVEQDVETGEQKPEVEANDPEHGLDLSI